MGKYGSEKTRILAYFTKCCENGTNSKIYGRLPQNLTFFRYSNSQVFFKEKQVKFEKVNVFFFHYAAKIKNLLLLKITTVRYTYPCFILFFVSSERKAVFFEKNLTVTEPQLLETNFFSSI